MSVNWTPVLSTIPEDKSLDDPNETTLFMGFPDALPLRQIDSPRPRQLLLDYHSYQQLQEKKKSKPFPSWKRPRPFTSRSKNTNDGAPQQALLNQCNNCDTKGRCIHHGIPLRSKRKKSIFGSSQWKILRTSCPACCIEKKIKGQVSNSENAATASIKRCSSSGSTNERNCSSEPRNNNGACLSDRSTPRKQPAKPTETSGDEHKDSLGFPIKFGIGACAKNTGVSIVPRRKTLDDLSRGDSNESCDSCFIIDKPSLASILSEDCGSDSCSSYSSEECCTETKTPDDQSRDDSSESCGPCSTDQQSLASLFSEDISCSSDGSEPSLASLSSGSIDIDSCSRRTDNTSIDFFSDSYDTIDTIFMATPKSMMTPPDEINIHKKGMRKLMYACEMEMECINGETIGYYSGTVNRDCIPHGDGVMMYEDGVKMEGEWNNGLPHHGV